MALNKVNNNYNTPLEIKVLQVNDSLVVGSSITASNAAFVNGIFYVGVDSLNLATVDHYTAPVAIFSLDNPDNYIQMALKNTAGGANSSADYIAYPDNGNDDYGYIDMGITSSGFGDPKFVLTGSNDGYIFMSGVKNTLAVTSATLLNGVVTIVTSTPHGYFQGDTVRLEINNGIVPTAYYAVTIVNIIDRYTFALTTTSSTYVSGILAQITDVYKTTGNGNLVLSTDATGKNNNIVLAAGGLATDTSQMTVTPNSITIGTANTGSISLGSVNSASSTFTATAGTNQVTLASITGVVVGLTVTGHPYVPAGTKVTAIDQTTLIVTLSNTMTGTGSINGTLYFSASMVGYEHIFQGLTTGTLTVAASPYRIRVPWACTVVGISAMVSTTPAGSPVIVDVLRAPSGSTTYTTLNTAVTTTVTGTSGQSTITVASATGIVPGMLVSGTGIATATGPVVVAVNGTTVTLSVANTGAVSGTGTFSNKVFINPAAVASSELAPTITSLAAGDTLQVSVTQIGSTTAGSNLTAFIRVRTT